MFHYYLYYCNYKASVSKRNIKSVSVTKMCFEHVNCLNKKKCLFVPKIVPLKEDFLFLFIDFFSVLKAKLTIWETCKNNQRTIKMKKRVEQRDIIFLTRAFQISGSSKVLANCCWGLVSFVLHWQRFWDKIHRKEWRH